MCPAGSADCDQIASNGCEVDLRSSVLHCGQCGQACLQGNNCVAAVCVPTQLNCPPGLEDCDGLPESGCEIHVLSDPRHCGACGNACAPGQTCQNGQCIETTLNCTPGRFDCDGNRFNGCEADLMLDPANCGGCRIACLPGQRCANGRCQNNLPLPCMPGRADCDARRDNGCEVDLLNDIRHCGSCGRACSPGQFCTTGRCGLPPVTCQPGTADCDGRPSNGCETNTATDPRNCGACRRRCGSGRTCRDGNCVRSTPTCQPGTADCDGRQWNGCETNIATDRNNCGSCRNRCQSGQGCMKGVCTGSGSTCRPGTADCDGRSSNGCETNLNTDEKNCGRCGNACRRGRRCSNGRCRR